jgi:hypothetical protein
MIRDRGQRFRIKVAMRDGFRAAMACAHLAEIVSDCAGRDSAEMMIRRGFYTEKLE